jgi:hypothetical protein
VPSGIPAPIGFARAGFFATVAMSQVHEEPTNVTGCLGVPLPVRRRKTTKTIESLYQKFVATQVSSLIPVFVSSSAL